MTEMLLLKRMNPGNSADHIFVPQYLEDMKEELVNTPPRDRDGFISPSSVMGCMTKALHQLNGEKKVVIPDPDGDDLCNIGILIHEYYQAKGQRFGLITDCEAFVDIPEWKVKGQIDGFGIKKSPKGEKHDRIFEIKTIGSFEFKKVRDYDKPLDRHLPQNLLYMKATKKRKTSFLYVERDYMKKKEVVYKYDPVLMKQVERWIKVVLRYEKLGTYPPAEEVWKKKTGKMGCDFCHYKWKCSKMYGKSNKKGLQLLDG